MALPLALRAAVGPARDEYTSLFIYVHVNNMAVRVAGRLEARAAAGRHGVGGSGVRAWRRLGQVRKRSKDSGNGGDLWVMLEECSACFGKRKEEHGRL